MEEFEPHIVRLTDGLTRLRQGGCKRLRVAKRKTGATWSIGNMVQTRGESIEMTLGTRWSESAPLGGALHPGAGAVLVS